MDDSLRCMIFQHLDRWEQVQLKQIHSGTYVRGDWQSVKGKQGNGQRSYARDNQVILKKRDTATGSLPKTCFIILVGSYNDVPNVDCVIAHSGTCSQLLKYVRSSCYIVF
jgi:hypothetical protein